MQQTSTRVYKCLRRALSSNSSLLEMLPELQSTLGLTNQVYLQRMNPQQVLAQIYGAVNDVLEQYEADCIHRPSNGISSPQYNDTDQQLQSVDNQSQESKVLCDKENEQLELSGRVTKQQQVNADSAERVTPREQYSEGDKNPKEEQDPEQVDNLDASDSGDVGIYGQEIDEDMESYENQGDEEQEHELEQEIGIQHGSWDNEEGGKGEFTGEDEAIEDNFEHFRGVDAGMANALAKPQGELEKTIARLEGKIISGANWVMKGEVKAGDRPVNSLLDYDLQFKQGIKFTHDITPQYNESLENVIKQRAVDGLFDDRVRYLAAEGLREHFGSLKEVSTQKSKQGLAEIYEAQFKNNLGLGENKEDRLKKEILFRFKEVSYCLDALSNFSFTPKALAKMQQAHITQAAMEKLPILFGDDTRESNSRKGKLHSEKEVDSKRKRLKNKRISRQRAKEQLLKKLNNKIAYGGITKFEAQTRKKILANVEDTAGGKYNKSARFFQAMNEQGSGKPNPDLGKARI